MFTDLPIDVIQYIALTNDPCDYLNIALVCKHFSGILSNTKEHPRRAKAIRHFTQMTIDKYGGKKWKLNGRLHRDNDKPAITWPDREKSWWQNGQIHRDNDKPARIWANGTKEWRQHGRLHRDNENPAIIYSDGTKAWYQNGLLHRDNDKPTIIWKDGRKEWWKNGIFIK